MKIVIISNFAINDNTPRAFRAKSLFETLKRLEHEVIFITPNDKIQKSKTQDVGKKPRSSLNNKARNLVSKFLYLILPDGKNFFKSIKLFGRIRQENVDLTISIGLPFTVHFMTALSILTGRLKTKKAVADYGDPYSSNPSINKPFYAKHLERWTLKSFDKISVPNKNSIPAYTNLVPIEQIITIPQGYNIKQDFSENYSENKISCFCFAGNLYKKIRNPSTFLQYLTTIQDDFEFHIYTDFRNTETMEILRPFKEKLKGKLILHSQVQRETCIEIMSRMEFLVNFSNKSSTQTPSKIIDYTLSSRPFINISQEQSTFDEFDKFLKKDYSKFTMPDISDFDEVLVSEKFLKIL